MYFNNNRTTRRSKNILRHPSVAMILVLVVLPVCGVFMFSVWFLFYDVFHSDISTLA